MTATPFVRDDWRRALQSVETVRAYGRVRRVSATHIEADGPLASLGTTCLVGHSLVAEVSGVGVDGVTLMPYGTVDGIRVGDLVERCREGMAIDTGDALLGRVLDALGRPLDGYAAPDASGTTWPLMGVHSPALERITPTRPLETGVRAIDALLTLGRGQRIGIFAGSGVGKSTLLASLCRHMRADVIVLCLVGERGREAQDFWFRALDDSSRKRALMVVSTSDEPAVKRVRGVHAALAHAEYFRSRGQHVLLLVDSMTRYAQAMREIGIASGEPPAVRAYTPGVFAALPRIIERCGALVGGGAITAIMTVLTETDDADDPMAESLRALLDGHIVLSRALAEQGHFPAIDVPRSVSRVFREVNDEANRSLAREAVAQLSAYEASRTLVESGLYAPGSQPALDRALDRRDALVSFLRQDAAQSSDMARTREALVAALGGNP
jgi:flagellum-specific ATP synthase